MILGSTGSIGVQALEIISANPERFKVVGLAAGGNNPDLETEFGEKANEYIQSLKQPK